MNEKLLYDLAYTVCRVIEEKRHLEIENDRLKKKVEEYDNYIANSVKENEKFIGDLFVTMIKGATS